MTELMGVSEHPADLCQHCASHWKVQGPRQRSTHTHSHVHTRLFAMCEDSVGLCALGKLLSGDMTGSGSKQQLGSFRSHQTITLRYFPA